MTSDFFDGNLENLDDILVSNLFFLTADVSCKMYTIVCMCMCVCVPSAFLGGLEFLGFNGV